MKRASNSDKEYRKWRYTFRKRPDNYSYKYMDWDERLNRILDRIELDYDFQNKFFLVGDISIMVIMNETYLINIDRELRDEYGCAVDEAGRISVRPSRKTLRRFEAVIDDLFSLWKRDEDIKKSINDDAKIIDP